MEALIYYYNVTKDPMVPYTIHRTLDWLWQNYDPVKYHAFAYNTAPPGPGCSCPNYTCPANVSWFVSDPTHVCNTSSDPAQFGGGQGQANLIDPGFAWYWSLSGDNKYLAEGDDAFQHALDDGLYDGKVFSQEYRWSFDYVKYRSGQSTLPPAPPGTAVTTPGSLSNVRVYPNPWRKDKHSGHPSITFANLPTGSTVKLFTVSGRKVKALNESGGAATWDLTNDSGDKVASGIYVYLIIDGQGNKVEGKVAVIK